MRAEPGGQNEMNIDAPFGDEKMRRRLERAAKKAAKLEAVTREAPPVSGVETVRAPESAEIAKDPLSTVPFEVPAEEGGASGVQRALEKETVAAETSAEDAFATSTVEQPPPDPNATVNVGQRAKAAERGETRRFLEDEERFSLEDADHELVRKYWPSYVGKGSSSIVYAVRGDSHVVAKANLQFLAESTSAPDFSPDEIERLPAGKRAEVEAWQKGLAEKGSADLPPIMRKLAESRIKSNKERHAKLREYFGHKSVPAMREFIAKVPVTPDMLQALHPGASSEELKQYRDAETVVTVQLARKEIMRKVRGEVDGGEQGPEAVTDAFPDLPDSVLDATQLAALDEWLARQEAPKPPKDLVSNYGEYLHPLPETYAKTYAALVENDGTELSSEDYQAIFPKQFTEMLDYADRDPALQQTLRDFTIRAMNYTRDLGEQVDLAGADNVTLYREGDGTWRYQIVDGLYGRGATLPDAGRAALELAAGKTPDRGSATNLLNAVNYVRTLNALATRLGLEDRFQWDAVKGKADPEQMREFLDKEFTNQLLRRRKGDQK